MKEFRLDPYQKYRSQRIKKSHPYCSHKYVERSYVERYRGSYFRRLSPVENRGKKKGRTKIVQKTDDKQTQTISQWLKLTDTVQ